MIKQRMMKKTLILIYCAFLSLTASAQAVDVYENGVKIDTYINDASTKVKVVLRRISSMEKAVPSQEDYVEINGVKWSKMNLGATTIAESPETCFGDFYAWGEIETYGTVPSYTHYVDEDGCDIFSGTMAFKTNATKTHIPGEKTGYDWDNYSGKNSSTLEWSTVPFDGYRKLTTSYDAAYQQTCGKWRMPTKDEFYMLFYNCGWRERSQYQPILCSSESSITSQGIYFVKYKEGGVKIGSTTYKVPGLLFVPDASDLDKVVFFPASGYLDNYTNTTGPNTIYSGAWGLYWTSELSSWSTNTYACDMYFARLTCQPYLDDGEWYRYLGCSIRPVLN